MELQDEVLSNLCSALEADSKSRKKSALGKIRKETLDKPHTDQEILVLFDKIFKNLLRCFSDKAEVCRELAIILVRDFFPRLPTLEPYLSYILPCLVKRIGSAEPQESSEEIRLLLVSLLRDVVVKSAPFLLPLLNDITSILSLGLLDPYPKVKVESCECIIDLTETIPKDFHVQSEAYIKGLILGMGHKHSKVRMRSIVAVGAVIQRGSHGLVEKVTGVLAERLYDSSPAVRQAVITTGGWWLKTLPDRYSQFARLLPLVLTGLQDEIEEVRQEAQQQWVAAGEQFLRENEEDFKKQIDFLSDKEPPGYPLPEARPSLGCRLLVQRESGKLLPAALEELHDWSLAVQLQAIVLLWQLVRHLEQRSVQHVARVWPELALVSVRPDLDSRLQNHVEGVCLLLGYFVPTGALLAVAVPQPQLSLGQLRCLASSLRGVPSLTGPELTSLSQALLTTSSSSLQPDYQRCALSCVGETLRAARVGGEVCDEQVSRNLFATLLTARGVGEQDLDSQVSELLTSLAEVCGSEIPQLYECHGHTLLSSLRASAAAWTDLSPEKSQFCAFVQGAGAGIGSHLTLVAEILILWARRASTGRALADLVRVCKPLLSWQHLRTCTQDPAPFLSTLLTGAVLPNLVWSAGRVAEARRSQALVLLLLAVSETLPEGVTAPLLEPLLPLLMSSLEETSRTDRLHAVHAIALLAPQWAAHLSPQHVQKAALGVAGRLDDAHSEVRLAAASCLKEVLLCLPAEHEALRAPWLAELHKSVLIHLDDEDHALRQAVLETLKAIGRFGTSQLLEMVRRTKSNFSNSEGCSALQQHLEALLP